MTLLVATDEAGYGPRLGPLVIVATAWRLASGADIATADKKLRQPITIDGAGSFYIDDSKRIFKQAKGTAKGAIVPIPAIDRITDAVASWVSLPVPNTDTANWLRAVAPDDFDSLIKQPWFQSLAEKGSPSENSDADPVTEELIRHWSSGGWQLVSISARIIDVARFNAMLDQSGNKADILSDSTCELAINLAMRSYNKTDKAIMIQSDRFGGRAYYAGLIQHHCPDYNVQAVVESSQSSRYRLIHSLPAQPTKPASRTGDKKSCPPAIEWAFNVNGDSFPPVAMSSIIAKSTRERLMGLLNRYFQAQTARYPSLGKKLKPTAGYTVDANRFLHDISPYRIEAGIDDKILIRKK